MGVRPRVAGHTAVSDSAGADPNRPRVVARLLRRVVHYGVILSKRGSDQIHEPCDYANAHVRPKHTPAPKVPLPPR